MIIILHVDGIAWVHVIITVLLLLLLLRLLKLCFFTLGYLCLNEAANLAIKDQELALKWINRNIEAFNGDSSRVKYTGDTIYIPREHNFLYGLVLFQVTLLGSGEGAVDIEVQLLNGSPRLFNRVWMSNKFITSPQAVYIKALNMSNCSSSLLTT